MTDRIEQQQEEIADPRWFREPTRREHAIAGALLVGFAVFFIALFIVHTGWWFRWVILGLAAISLWHGVKHAAAMRRAS